MNTVLSFPAERCRRGELKEHGHHCFVIPFPCAQRPDGQPSVRQRTKSATAKAKDKHGKPYTMKTPNHPSTPVLRRMELLLKALGEARGGEALPWDYAAKLLSGTGGMDRLECATVFELERVMMMLQTEMAQAAWDAEEV